jgi:hypothetical protein
MKDFKKMVKMATGGGVDDIAEAFRSGKAKPAPMPSDKGNRDYGFDVPGMGRVKPIEMPRKTREAIHEAMLLKKGGKVKRGNKKK